MLKISIAVLISAVSFITACSSQNYNLPASKEPNAKKTTGAFPVQKSSSSYITYDNIESLVDAADLVIIGKTENKFEDSVPVSINKELQTKREVKLNESITVKDEEGFIRDSYTVTPVKVMKVLKGNTDDKVLKVIQAGALIEEAGSSKRTLDSEDFSPLVQKSKYLLFLKQVDATTFPNLAGAYSIMSVNQGKFNLDKTDSKEEAFAGKSPKYGDLKRSALERFKKEAEAIP
jgi:hypothetical protein